ncbi:MAG: SDR family NAD(P)-dependent oxidoreductase [Actinomycetota bacterium]|nr:SDR family NAD(P)-dependent oxidoreductase [Actinomycetota bacterium]
MEVDGKVAVVTGAASGMGLAMAHTFANSGMKVVLADIEDDVLKQVTTELNEAGHDVIGVRTDVSKLEEVQALAERTLQKFGAVHVLCNNAGVGVGAPVGNTSIADWKWTLDIDLWGPIYGVETFLPLIEEQGEGHINSTASMAGLYAGASLGAYNVAKHGVVALMASLERDLRWRDSKVRASVLCPGPINTNIVDSERNRDPDDAARHTDSEQGQKFWDFLTRTLATGMDPAEVGPMVLDAIVNEKFWILTHPEMGEIAVNQSRAMLEDQRLTR